MAQHEGNRLAHDQGNRVAQYSGNWVAQDGGNSTVNYLGRMSTYSPKRESILVDVLDENDSLYSGIFYDYFTEGRKPIGIRIARALRYSFRSETDRKDSEPRSVHLPYIVPNDGQMFFPMDKIQNLHFWKIRKDQEDVLELNTPEKQIRFAWLLGLKYSLPHLKIKVTGVLDDTASPEINLKYLRKSFNTLRIDNELVFDNIVLKSDLVEKTPAH
jgi:hypothetical protein